jgi:phosphoglycolate phosphatase-like HAD superfamily hydrolase
VRALILDFDGVVLESNDVKTSAFRQVFARYPAHADAMMEFHHRNVSLGRFDKFEHLLRLLGRPGDGALRDELAAEFSRRTLEGVIAAPFVAGAEAFLRDVAPRLPLYLASVTPEEDLTRILAQRGLAQWFRRAYGCPPWTKPSAIRDVLAREGIAPSQALLVGDSAGDQRAAAETGVGFVGRDGGLGFDSPAPIRFPDLSGVADYLKERLP